MTDDEWVPVRRPSAEPAAPAAHADAGDEWEDVRRSNDPVASEFRDMPWSEVGKRAVSSFPRSAVENLTAIPQALMHPSDTASAIGDVAKGAYSKAKGLVTDQDPAQKAKDERTFDQVFSPYTDAAPTWMGGKGDTTKLKQTIAEDPFAVASMAVAPLSGGAGALGKVASVAGEASKVGKIAGAASKAAKVASSVADPGATLATHIPGAVDFAKSSVQKGVSLATGVPEEAFKTAYEVGKLPADHPHRQMFEAFSSGNGNPVEFSQSAKKALDAIRQSHLAEWRRSKEGMMGAMKAVDFAPLYDSLDAVERKMGNRAHSMETDAFKRLDAIRDNLKAREAAGLSGASVEEVDALKRWFYTQMKDAKSFDQEVLNAGYNGAKSALSKSAPGYMQLMENYTTLLDDLQNIEKKMGTGDRVAASSELARALRSSMTPDGAKIFERVAEHSPELPYMLHGSMLHGAAAHGGAGMFELGSGLFHGSSIAGEALSGHPVMALGHAGLAAAQFAAQSPHLIGESAKGSGKIAGKLQGFMSAIPLSDAVKAGAKAVPAAAKSAAKKSTRAVSTLQQNKDNRFDVQFAEKRGGRIGRMAGGRIVRALTADQLITGLERSRNRQKKSTEPILNKPDESVVRALEIANQHI